jgi:flagellar export protein FliJ
VENFRFRLERVLSWQRVVTELEEARTRQWLAALAETQAGRVQLAAARREAEEQLMTASALRPQELDTLADYREGLATRDRELRKREQNCEQRLEEQRRRWMEARRRCRLLEKLRERRLAEYRIELDRELETLAMESFAAGRSRDKRNSKPGGGRTTTAT